MLRIRPSPISRIVGTLVWKNGGKCKTGDVNLVEGGSLEETLGDATGQKSRRRHRKSNFRVTSLLPGGIPFRLATSYLTDDKGPLDVKFHENVTRRFRVFSIASSLPLRFEVGLTMAYPLFVNSFLEFEKHSNTHFRESIFIRDVIPIRVYFYL